MSLRKCVVVSLGALAVAVSVQAGANSAAVAGPPSRGGPEPVGASASWTAVNSAADANAGVASYWYRPIGSGESQCLRYEFCIWWATEFGATDTVFPVGMAFRGNLTNCDGMNWQGERFENHVFSIKNNTPYTFTIWDRIAGGAEHYTRLFVSPSGNKGNFDLAGGKRADAIAFDLYGSDPLRACAQPKRVTHM